ncbi:MAG: hypothetical protein A2358_01095 [Candidatus Staskawiczbacteria bacterium RIFOXYB1_FULL_37_44]|uniref:PEGA domain-containing protein n=1 Tax=Candidatus Staskawiczbacteria bacterium RIFOXYB1_FULL_37_44 TaxID=1802223 RepID=A0A1G2IWW7_9BACT|nr:MAG: hypothetical protein A2358_01095 [Candidatus Staskawiczbacteria bacterium RIFOXYB1_FULL_37_44]OGZ84758.1 MAG: hypothetical protein A2416_01105 [Candidatus Staskawiczbacteria bacterium RIFOXYC1_FULL_37_52]OGZ89076.1 MAG: hypothetical protein A2444_00800 [Candidatus Staskawiczbacteria bacterium RIFOXYC2_FULL_37_19]OGZ90371.1 MAG: hypothetical protein A2581_01065 [Candidatus Staskawiczbacteria bacterium RIFOXYD1_FULL_37_110]
MQKKTRLIILLVCVVCFFSIAPILVAYSMGYRFDFENKKIVATGGIYVRTFPAAGKIIIDSGVSQKPGLFANSIFVQSLLPKNHTVAIEKTGYYGYSKTLAVQENQVTKLENVLLIKNNIAFSNLADKIDYFSVSPNNQNIIGAISGNKIINFSYFSINSASSAKIFSISQTGKVSEIKWSGDSSKALIKIENSGNIFYYFFDGALQKPSAARLSYLDKNSQQISFNPQNPSALFFIKNNTLYSASGNSALPIINNIISYKISGANIIWLSAKGSLSSADLLGKTVSKISLKDYPVNSKKAYEITSILSDTFLKEDSSLFKLNPNTKTFESFTIPKILNYKILSSPDNKNLIYWSVDNIYLYSFENEKFSEIFSGNKIANLQWLNNDYIIFNSEEKIIISEIDYRGNVNTVTLPQTATNMFLNQQTEKLYVLSGNSLLVSEKITP